jgi:diguanylate cyclase (GGDEF)-like protein/putative nucleotidyltransferase with HDIG domain/PAS domain S-box-containing protein
MKEEPVSKESFNELRRQAEERLARRERQIESLERADVAKLAQELAVHQVELEIQNEELRQARAAAEEARDRYLDLYDFAPVGYFTLDEHSRIAEANLTASNLLKMETRRNLLNTHFTKFINSEESERFHLYQRKALESENRQTLELKMQKADGTPFDAQLISVKAGLGRLRIAVIDITERKRAEETIKRFSQEMSQLSITDELTKIYNRRHFYKVLEIETDRARRYDRPLSLAILDVDRFKDYNDKFGHLSGDSILISLAGVMTSNLRKTDTSFRYGGDEFAIILPETDSNKAKVVIERMRLKWVRMPRSESLRLENSFGFSAGIVEFPKNAEAQDSLVFLADAALYCSKRSGGNRSTLVSEIGEIPHDMLASSTVEQVNALAATVDAKEAHGYEHSKRVANIAETIGNNVGLSSDELADLRGACLLHDIGKIGISNAILNKSDRLTPSEWETIKKHSIEGEKIVSQIKKTSNLAPLIRHHHEWYDGSGYPDGLKGQEIPLVSRIICIADAYDTMITPRSYGNVMSGNEALIELEQCSGTQFDPEIIKDASSALSQISRVLGKKRENVGTA